MNYQSFSRYFSVAFCGLYLVFFMHLYQPNMGGEGLNLPINISGWFVITGMIGVGIVLTMSQRVIAGSPSLLLFVAACCLLCMPLLYPDVRWVNTIGRMAGLIGGIIFYAALQQNLIVKRNSKLLLVFILISAWVEAVYALLQFFVFDIDNWMEFKPGQRAYGIFQQVNVLASYLATGSGVAIYLFYKNHIGTDKKRLDKILDASLLISIAFFSFIIVLSSSRIGYIGGIAASLILIGCFHKQSPKRTLLIVVAIATGSIAAKFDLPVSWSESLAHEVSNTRRVMMIEQSMAMIMQRPWLGWGYGSFEYSFQHFVGEQYPQVVNYGLVKHPHNELLYWWVEGGFIALLGMLLIAVGYLLPVVRKFCRNRFALWALTLPIALHTMVEYPLYQSVPHLMVVLILLAIVDGNPRDITLTTPRAKLVATATQACLLLGAVGAMAFLVTGIQANKVLTKIERNGMRDFSQAETLINPYISWQRFQFDKNINKLVRFNQTKDAAYLLSYEQWAESYSHIHIDLNVYLTRAKIARALSDPIKAERLMMEAKKLTPLSFHGKVVMLKNTNK